MSTKSIARASACLYAFITVHTVNAASSSETIAPAIEEAAAEINSTDANGEDNTAILVVGQKDAPINIEPRGLAVSLGDEQFAGINAFNTEDLMKYAPNFFVRKRYAGDSNGVPGFRGTHSTQSARTLVMVDGFVVSNLLGNSFGFAPKWGVVGPSEVKQFDIIYGPYSSRYSGNSMGGIVNITSRDPQETEAFVTTQGFVQPYKQFGTDKSYFGYSGEAGFGWKQNDGPFSVRISARHFRNDGQPQSWYGLSPTTGNGTLVNGPVVTGAVIDPAQAITGTPGIAANPIFAAQSPAAITQDQAKLKIGYDNGSVTGQFLFAYWHNADDQFEPDCYLRDASGNKFCEGKVTFGATTYNAAGANWSKTVRDEYLAGLKLAAPIDENSTAHLALSSYQIAKSDGFTSNGYVAGQLNGAGTLARQGPTGWYTGDLTIEHKTDISELSAGLTANMYQTDLTRFTLANWKSAAVRNFSTQTFGKTRLLSAWVDSRFILNALTINMGVRYDNWRAFDGGLGRLGTGLLAGQQVTNIYASRSDAAFSPSISAQYQLPDNTLLQLSLAMATRFPTVGELFQGGLNGDGSFNINGFDPNLKAERSHDANLLISHDFDWITLTGSAFYQRVNSAIFAFAGFNQNLVTTSSFKNIDLTRQFGLEAIAETKNWPVEGMNIDANAAYIDAKTLRNVAAPAAEGVQFPRIPKWRINANIRYDIADAIQASLGIRYASRPNTDLFGLQRGDTFGYTSELFALDAKLNWNVTENIRASFGVDNITNDKAWVFHPYPQRTVLIEAGWKL